MERVKNTRKSSANSTERVYSTLRMMAMTYRFKPGERINEVALAQQLEVSRTPIREALNRLSMAGFVVAVPNRGFVGRTLSADDIMRLYEYRCVVEQGIVRLACERASDKELQDLVALAKSNLEMEGPEPSHDDLCRDEDFHVAIAQLTRNHELVNTLESINARLHFVRWIDLRIRPRKRSHNGHVELARLIASRDMEKSAGYIVSMLHRRHDEIMEIIRNGVIDIYVDSAEG